MKILKKAAVIAMAVAGLFPAINSEASVSLALAKDPVLKSGTSTTVTAGQTFSVSVFAISNGTAASDSIYSVQYKLTSSGPTDGAFTLTARDATTNAGANPFNDFINSDAVITSVANASLNPENNADLGALVSSLSLAVPSNNYGNGTTTFNPQLIAKYTVAVAPTANGGTYNLSLSSTGYGYLDSVTGIFFDGSVSAPPSGSPLNSSFTVNVAALPEPSSLALIGIGGMLALRRRRK